MFGYNNLFKKDGSVEGTFGLSNFDDLKNC